MGSYSGNYRQLPGMMASPKRPNAIAPVPEEYEGTNFPYRGTETHGVQPSPNVDPEDYYDHDSYDAGPEQIPTLPAEKEPEPIRVKVVSDTARERYAFRTYTFPANGLTGKQLCGRNDKRKKVRIKNHSTATQDLIIGPSSGLDLVTGYVIQPGQELELETTEEIYVMNASGNADVYVTAAVCEEVSVEI